MAQMASRNFCYGFGAPGLVDQLWSMQLPFGISITSSVALATSYGAEVQLHQRVRRIVDERRILTRR